MTETRNILIVGPSWVGDMVMAQCLFTQLKVNEPQCNIDVLAPDWSRALLARMPEVRRAIAMPVGHGKLQWAVRKQVARRLKDEQYDQAIILPNSFKSALIPWMAGIPLRTGWRGEMRFGLVNDMRVLDKQRYPLMVQRFTALAYDKHADVPEHIPRPKLLPSIENTQTALRKFYLETDKPILALCPGAEFGPAKRWPAEYYAQVAQTKIDEGWHVWLFGSAKDQEVAAVIQDITGQRCRDLTGKTNLGEAIDLLALADVVVTNDSGLMHVSAALDRAIVVAYGSSSPTFTPPLAKHIKILNKQLPCSPCFKRECPFGHLNCLNDIAPAEVLDAVAELEPECVS